MLPYEMRASQRVPSIPCNLSSTLKKNKICQPFLYGKKKNFKKVGGLRSAMQVPTNSNLTERRALSEGELLQKP